MEGYLNIIEFEPLFLNTILEVIKVKRTDVALDPAIVLTVDMTVRPMVSIEEKDHTRFSLRRKRWKGTRT